MGSQVCLVEDESLIREMTLADLEDIGFSVVPMERCDEAWEAIRAGVRFDVLVTDIVTPGEFNGWELARRARTVWPELPIVYVSGYSAEGIRPVEGSVFLSKPYLIRELQAAIEQVASG